MQSSGSAKTAEPNPVGSGVGVASNVGDVPTVGVASDVGDVPTVGATVGSGCAEAGCAAGVDAADGVSVTDGDGAAGADGALHAASTNARPITKVGLFTPKPCHRCPAAELRSSSAQPGPGDASTVGDAVCSGSEDASFEPAGISPLPGGALRDPVGWIEHPMHAMITSMIDARAAGLRIMRPILEVGPYGRNAGRHR